MPKLQIYNTSSGHHVQFLKRAKEDNSSSTRVVLSQLTFWTGDARERPPTANIC